MRCESQRTKSPLVRCYLAGSTLWPSRVVTYTHTCKLSHSHRSSNAPTQPTHNPNRWCDKWKVLNYCVMFYIPPWLNNPAQSITVSEIFIQPCLKSKNVCSSSVTDEPCHRPGIRHGWIYFHCQCLGWSTKHGALVARTEVFTNVGYFCWSLVLTELPTRAIELP